MKYDFIAIDFETANNNMNSACSLGIIAVTDLEIVSSEYFLIKPPTDHFRHENVDIHGITFEDVKNCGCFPEVYPSLRQYIDNAQYVLAHNAQFDMTVLHEALKTYQLEMPDFTYMDTISISSKMRSGCGNSLVDCANYFNIPIANHHNALEDATVCAKIAIESVNRSRYKDFSTYIRSYSSIHKRQFCDLKSHKQMKGGRRFNNVKISELTADAPCTNTDNPFYGKNCVLTGELESFSRRDAMQKIINAGGIVKSGVSKRTDYLIVGKQDKALVGEDGLSTKEEKAYKLIQEGNPIKIISEDEFLELLQ